MLKQHRLLDKKKKFVGKERLIKRKIALGDITIPNLCASKLYFNFFKAKIDRITKRN